MKTQPETPTQTAAIPTVEEIMDRYDVDDPEVGHALWCIVTRPLRWPELLSDSSSTRARHVSTGHEQDG